MNLVGKPLRKITLEISTRRRETETTVHLRETGYQDRVLLPQGSSPSYWLVIKQQHDVHANLLFIARSNEPRKCFA